ncbi:FkbM family methyltransferase [Campylobacter troglodytis]|nr:FkbM family methyltransferase [Campylobacter troglodytis]
MFYDFYLRKERGERLVFVDAGCHNGVFADLALACGGLCYAFEPNIYLCAFLRNLYKNKADFILHEAAISTQDGKTIFYDESDENAVGQGGSVVKWDFQGQSKGYEVRLINFCEFIKSLVAKHGRINLVKIDIEGAEFEVLDAILEQNLHENIEYLMVETHERFFADPASKLSVLKDKIATKNAKNVYLDWV